MSTIALGKLGTALAELEAAWPDRLADAEALLIAGRYGWAIATGLYALEIRLKALVCRRLDVTGLPKGLETHDLPALLLFAGLSNRITRKPARGVKRSWDGVLDFAPQLNDYRYSADAKWPGHRALQFFSYLRDPPYGVMLWLSKVR